MQQLTGFRLFNWQRVARSFCDSWASCYPQMPIAKVWIYPLLYVCFLFVCLFAGFVCTVRDFSSGDKASGVKLCTEVHGALGRESPILRNFVPRKPKIWRIGHPPGSKVQCWNGYRNRQRWQRVRSACVDNVRSEDGRIYLLNFWGLISYLWNRWNHESRHFKFSVEIDTDECYCMIVRLPRRGCVEGHVTSLNFGEIW